jgi:hypothetical protein
MHRSATRDNIPECIRTISYLINPPKGFVFDMSSIRKFTDNNTYGMMFTHTISQDYVEDEDEVSKKSFKEANIGLIPGIVKVIEIGNMDSMLSCTEEDALKYIEENKDKIDKLYEENKKEEEDDEEEDDEEEDEEEDDEEEDKEEIKRRRRENDEEYEELEGEDFNLEYGGGGEIKEDLQVGPGIFPDSSLCIALDDKNYRILLICKLGPITEKQFKSFNTNLHQINDFKSTKLDEFHFITFSCSKVEFNKFWKRNAG